MLCVLTGVSLIIGVATGVPSLTFFCGISKAVTVDVGKTLLPVVSFKKPSFFNCSTQFFTRAVVENIEEEDCDIEIKGY